jgi:uncharacterized protein YjeT (DUF2065 family)
MRVNPDRRLRYAGLVLILMGVIEIGLGVSLILR